MKKSQEATHVTSMCDISALQHIKNLLEPIFDGDNSNQVVASKKIL